VTDQFPFSGSLLQIRALACIFNQQRSIYEMERPLRYHLLLLLLLVQQGAVVTGTVTCQLHMEGYGHITGLKAAHMACSGGMIKAAAHPMLAPFRHSFSGVQWINTDGCGVGRRDCLLTICGDTTALFEAAAVTGVNVSTAAQSLLCVGGRSNIAFQRAGFHGNTARCISVLQQPSNATVWLHLNKCVFTNNSAPVDVGGAIALAGGTTLVEGSTFSGNSVQERGGAIGVMHTARATIISTLFQRNKGSRYHRHAVASARLSMCCFCAGRMVHDTAHGHTYLPCTIHELVCLHVAFSIY
jgi:hypothetical protein